MATENPKLHELRRSTTIVTTATLSDNLSASGTQLYRVHEAMRVLSLSRSAVYRLIRSGRLRTVNEGRTRLVPASAIADYIALLEQEAEVAR
jgi:excisionase family DNA binding protein